MTGSGAAAPRARRCTRRRRLSVCPVAEDDTTTFPLAQCACGPGSGAEASGSTKGSHRHHSAPGPRDSARDPSCSELDVRRAVSEAADPAVSRSESAICHYLRRRQRLPLITLGNAHAGRRHRRKPRWLRPDGLASWEAGCLCHCFRASGGCHQIRVDQATGALGTSPRIRRKLAAWSRSTTSAGSLTCRDLGCRRREGTGSGVADRSLSCISPGLAWGLTWGFGWQVLGSNQRRLSRRFYRPFLPDHRNGR